MIDLACPSCRRALCPHAGALLCTACGAEYRQVDGIHRFLPAERAAHFQAFLADYTAIRIAEGRASADPGYFRRLPEPTPGGPLESQWELRRRSWTTVRRRAVGPAPPALEVVDIGAGVGWLSNRLADLGHHPYAVDLSVDPDDGLGAARHFEHSFPRMQAEMDAMPFGDGSADVVVFNASLHYSCDYHRTLVEALRVLAPRGRIIVLDSPIYRHTAAGEAMVAERRLDFERRFGTRSDSLPSIGYLTPAMLHHLAGSLGLRWRRHHTWYGWAWAWRPWQARLRSQRAPSRFTVLVGRRA
ncbi:MAG: methylase [Acidimicrobiaceae bacterium]|nr:MAG: methylase [Acidimicrobiaceae bacterium]